MKQKEENYLTIEKLEKAFEIARKKPNTFTFPMPIIVSYSFWKLLQKLAREKK